MLSALFSALTSFLISQWMGILVGLVIAWHLPIPPVFAQLWAWVWVQFTNMFTQATTPTPPPPGANT